MILKQSHIHPGMNTEPVPDNPPRNLQRQPYHLPARPQKEDGHVFASIKYAIHRTKGAQILLSRDSGSPVTSFNIDVLQAIRSSLSNNVFTLEKANPNLKDFD
ncbi:hypothetical protein TURU_099939 [Turdus rufiventris]|nr:hypothetical protein TURU_099939 [Turdus rufiventris]